MLFANHDKKAELWPAGRVLPLLFAFALLLGACGRKERLPQGIMDTAQVAAFLADAYLLEGYYAVASNHNYDTVDAEFLKSYDELLRSYRVTRAVVDSSLAYYASQPEMFAAINDAVLRRMEKENGPSEPERPTGIEIKLK